MGTPKGTVQTDSFNGTFMIGGTILFLRIPTLNYLKIEFDDVDKTTFL